MGETLDAIGDHNDIRDGVRAANAAAVGTDDWWAGVGSARVANDDHMAEEERDRSERCEPAVGDGHQQV